MATNAGNFLDIQGGREVQVAALATSAGATDAGKIVKTNAAGEIDPTLIPGADTVRTMTASEAISAGDFINVHSSSGAKVRKADATTSGKEAVGYAPASISNGASGEIRFGGVNSSLSGMTIGARQYLSTTAGGRTETPPSGSGQVVQYLGLALSATELDFENEDGVILA